MLPAEVESALRRIVSAIEAIEQATTGMDCDGFRENPTAIAAVVRNLEVISESAVLLGRDAEARCPGPPRREIRGICNWLRKRQEWSWLAAVWKTATNDLPPVKSAVLPILRYRRLPAKTRLALPGRAGKDCFERYLGTRKISFLGGERKRLFAELSVYEKDRPWFSSQFLRRFRDLGLVRRGRGSTAHISVFEISKSN